MAFWGCAVKPDKEAAFVPSAEVDEKLHLSQVCLAPGASKNARATLLLRVGENEEPLAVAALREGTAESAPLDLVIDEYTEFSVVGTASVHITGYMMPEYALDGGDEEADDEDDLYGDDGGLLEGGHAEGFIGFDEYGQPVFADEYDSQEDSDFDSEDFDSAEEGPSEDESDEDEEDSEEDDSEDEEGLGRRTSSVTIEDITDKDEAAAAAGKNKKALPALPAHEKKAAEFADDDVEGSDEESEEESEEEEEPPKPAPKGKKAAAAAAKKEEAAPAAKKAAAKKEPAKKEVVKKEKEEKKEPAAAAKGQKRKAEEPASVKKEGAAGGKRVRRFANGFEIEDVAMGPANGKLAKPGKRVAVRYVGKLKNGKVFDQTKGGKTFTFRLGVGEVIKGWDRGVEGMRVGDKRRLVIPPQMGYGASRTGPIPPNSELHFDVELVDVKG